MSAGGDDDLRVVARYDDTDTGQEMVTIENEITGENWTRP